MADAVTCSDIERALVRGLSAKYPYRRWLVVPNVSWGFLNWEADLVAVSQSGWMHEIEIKVSVSDLRRDLDKNKFKSPYKCLYSEEMKTRPTPGTSKYIHQFWYAMPEAIWSKIESSPPIPDYAGVYVIGDLGRAGRSWRIAKPAIKNKFAKALTEAEQSKLLRLCMIKYWARNYMVSPSSPEGEGK